MPKTFRRLISIPAVLIALPLLLVSAPLWLAIGLILDLAQGLRRLPTVRLGLFTGAYLAHEYLGILAGLGLYLRYLGSGRRDLAALERYRRVQVWWIDSLLRWASRLLHVRFDLDPAEPLPEGGFIVLSRHASMVDAVLPVHVIAGHLDRFVHYVIKRELLWDPGIDIFGQRLGNYFVARRGDTDAEVEAIAEFAASALLDSVLVIFPEGTYATEAQRAKVVASLERRSAPQLLALATNLEHLLPPKPAGTMALLAEQPDLDVVIFGHVGLEGVAQLSGLRRRLPLRDPIVIRWWWKRRAEIPTDNSATIDWLNNQWRTLDRWVDSHTTAPADRRTSGE